MAGNRPLRRFAQVFGLIVLLTHGYLSAHAQGFELNDGASIRLLSESRSLYLGASSLFTHTDFMRETTGTRIAVVDGKVVEIALRRIELMPKQQGLLVLGPLRGEASAGNIKSNSLAINVVAAPEEDWQPEPSPRRRKNRASRTHRLRHNTINGRTTSHRQQQRNA